MDSKHLKVALILCNLILALSSEEPLPECHEEVVVFTTSPQNAIVPCGSDMSAEFHCQYTYHGSEGTERPWWTIGSVTYRTNLPENHDYDGSTNVLHVINISVNQNNTAYVCEFHTMQEDGSSCAYRSAPGIIMLLCEVSEVQYELHYQYISMSKPATLKRIATIITQNMHNHFINRSIVCSIIFSNSNSNAVCHNDTFPVDSSNCVDRVCEHSFDILTSTCAHMEGVNASVRITEHDRDLLLSDTTKIDSFNNFINISFDDRSREKSIVNCSFIEQQMDSKKICFVSAGPNTPKCDVMMTHGQGDIEDGSSNSYVAFDIDLSFLSSQDMKFCFIVNASTEPGIKRVILSGVYDTASALTVYHLPVTLSVAFIFCGGRIILTILLSLH